MKYLSLIGNLYDSAQIYMKICKAKSIENEWILLSTWVSTNFHSGDESSTETALEEHKIVPNLINQTKEFLK